MTPRRYFSIVPQTIIACALKKYMKQKGNLKMTSIRKASEIFKDTHIPVHVIGDAKSPLILMHAISEAEDIGRAV